MTTTKTKINVPGRLIDFYEGGGAYQAWTGGDPANRDWPDTDELELFEAVVQATRDGKRRKAKGGYWVPVELSPAGISALRYWAETLETAAADNAPYDSAAKLELRAAQRVLKAL